MIWKGKCFESQFPYSQSHDNGTNYLDAIKIKQVKYTAQDNGEFLNNF